MKLLRTLILPLCIVTSLQAQDAATDDFGYDASLPGLPDAPSGPDSPDVPPSPVEAPETPAPRAIETPAPVTPPAPESLQLTLPPAEQVVLEMPGGAAHRSIVSRDAETISVDFPDEEVRTIVRNVADLYELNVVIPDTLVGSVSLKLRNVTWRQVFDVVLTPLGYTYVEEGNIVKIRSQQELMAEPVDTRVFIINFATAGELSPVLGPLIEAPAGGRIQVDTRSNALIITERPSRMGRIIEIIERLDRPTEQVMIESKFVEVTNRDLFDLGINWSSLRAFGGSADLGRDIARTRTTDNENGWEYSGASNVTGGMPPVTSYTDTGRWNSLINTVRTDTAVFDLDTFNVLLSALESNDEIELISNPTVVTLNNTPAVIHIGEQYPEPNYQYNQEQGVLEVSGFNRTNIGISLEVLPQVNTAGFINLRIQPEISSRTGTVPFGGGGSGTVNIPIITRRTTQSTVTIKNGYTLAIGGLMERQTSTVDTKVPVLGDIPLLGRLFRHDSDTRDQRNLIIFITAKILNADGSTYRDVFSQRRLYEMGIKSRDLPGYAPPPEEEEMFSELQLARDQLEQLRAEARLQAQLLELQKRQGKEQKKAEKTARRSGR